MYRSQPATRSQGPPKDLGDLCKDFHLIDKLTEMRLLAAGQGHTSVSFKQGNQWYRILKGDAPLIARRHMAIHMTPETIHSLRKRPDPRRPNLELMQNLYDAGIHQCPASGAPVFDPSKLSEEERAAWWRVLCLVPDAIDDPSHAQALLKALDMWHGMIKDRAAQAGGTEADRAEANGEAAEEEATLREEDEDSEPDWMEGLW